MSPKKRLIIDTDPGVDDILGLLLACSAKSEDLEILLISATYGNTDVQNCLRNVVSLFHIIQLEQEWRRKQGKPEGFEALKARKPLVAVGPDGPLHEQELAFDNFYGNDGLGCIHTTVRISPDPPDDDSAESARHDTLPKIPNSLTQQLTRIHSIQHPHLTPSSAWQSLFSHPRPTSTANPADAAPSSTLPPQDISTELQHPHLFEPSTTPSHQLILQLLRDNEPGTITIAAIGPMTDLALAAAEDLEAFLRVKEVVVMGGAILEPGNITPLAEFNIHADPLAAALILSLTSPTPSSTQPPFPSSASNPTTPRFPTARPPNTNPLPLTLLPLDITNTHTLPSALYRTLTAPLARQHSPLAEWCTAFLEYSFGKMEGQGGGGLGLHDPLALFYAETAPGSSGGGGGGVSDGSDAKWGVEHGQDVRVETTGQWTRGSCVVDHRPWAGKRKKKEDGGQEGGGRGGWFDEAKGNRVGVVGRLVVGERVAAEGGGEGEQVREQEDFARVMMQRIFMVE